MSTFLQYVGLNIGMVEFDTEDNIFRTNRTPWEQNLNLSTLEPLSTYGLRWYAPTKLWFKSINDIKSIRINNFPQKYSVKKINSNYFEIKSEYLQTYFDGCDNITIVVKFN